MKKTFLLSLLLLGTFATLFAQNSPAWTVPMHEVKYNDDSGAAASLRIDPGYQFASINQEGQAIRFLFNRNRPNFSQARIINQETGEMIARGKGGFFLGNAKMVFADGTTLKLQRKKSPNGYEITGPYGPVFKVENFGIEPVNALTREDFLTQTFFVFDRIRATQQPPAEIIYLYSSNTFN